MSDFSDDPSRLGYRQMNRFDPPARRKADFCDGSSDRSFPPSNPLEEGMERHRRGDAAGALKFFRLALPTAPDLPDAETAPVLVTIAACLIESFRVDSQSPHAYDFLRDLNAETAEVMAGLIQLANFPTGEVDPRKVDKAVFLSYTGLLTAAKRFDEAIDLLSAAVIGSFDLAERHALFVARRRKEGRPDSLRGLFCPVPFERFDILPGGHVHVCSAARMHETIGNIFSQDWERVWNSPKARAIRASVHDGTYRFCDKVKCPFIEKETLFPTSAETALTPSQTLDPELKNVAESKATTLASPPRTVSLSYDLSCNLSCPSCRTELTLAKPPEAKFLLEVSDRKILPLLAKVGDVMLSGCGDPFASKSMRHVLKSLNSKQYPHLKLKIMTNGILLTEERWKDMPNLRGMVDSVWISIDAADPETYAVLRRGGDWNKLLKNLEFLGRARASGEFRNLAILFVVQARNWREMPEFVRMGRRVGATSIHFNAIENWGAYTAPQFAELAVHFPGHPEHLEFKELLRSPVFDDPIVDFNVLTPLRLQALERDAHGDSNGPTGVHGTQRDNPTRGRP